MENEYVWGLNPIKDTLLQMILYDVDISDKQFKKELNTIITIILENFQIAHEDLVYLDFKIIKNDMHYQIIGNNIITALWLSDILPENPQAVYDSNECCIGGKLYTFDKKRKILSSKNYEGK